MILAAGLGTRLRPLTDRLPKALIEVGGATMLEQVARRLIAAGADRLVVNVHHFADEIELHVAERGGFGVPVAFSRERDAPLETGGGLLHAAPLLRRDAPFFLHNADVLTDADLAGIYRTHVESGALATLAVMRRESTRQLLFDDAGLLGRTDAAKALELRARAPVGAVHAFAFAGIHVVSPQLLERITERGAFSILEPYLRLAGEGAAIRPYHVDAARWFDVGKPAQLEEARAWSAPAARG